MVRLIMEHLGYPLDLILRDPDQIPDPPLLKQMTRIIADINKGIPIQYILGETYFCDLRIEVDKHVLIPRPETEEMVEHIKSKGMGRIRRIIDLGTGSGCIALALKQYFPDAKVWGVDNSMHALSLADKNGKKNKLQVRWDKMDMLRQHDRAKMPDFDLVVSNPPYVMDRERKLMAQHVLDFEPEAALFVPDDDPLLFYRAIASFSNKNLAVGGEVWVEINEQFGKDTAKLFEGDGFLNTRILKDIHQKDRYINACR